MLGVKLSNNDDDAGLKSHIFEKKDYVIGSRYKKYWFVLSNAKILKYKNIGSKILDVIELDKISNVSCNVMDNKKFIELTDVNNIVRTIYFNDFNECDIWFNNINNILNNIKVFKINGSIEILESIGDPCVITNSNFDIIGYNKLAENLFEYKKSDVLNKSIRLFMMDYYSKYYSDIFNSKKIAECITKKMFIKSYSGKKIPVFLSIGEYIFKEFICKIYIHIFRSLDISDSDESDNIENRKIKIFDYINKNSEDLKNAISQQYIIDSKIRDIFIQKMRILEEENKLLTNELNSSKKIIKDLEENLTYFKRKSYKINLIQVLSHEYSFNSFLEFCKDNKNEENILFWKDINSLKNKFIDDINNPALEGDVRTIYDKYFNGLSNYELNLPAKIKQNIIDNLNKSTNLYNIFDDALFHVIQNLNDELFPIYSNTKEGRKILSLLQI